MHTYLQPSLIPTSTSALQFELGRHLMQTCHSLTVSGIHIVRRCIVVAVSDDMSFAADSTLCLRVLRKIQDSFCR